MKTCKTASSLNEYFTLKNAISNRIEALENFYDDNLMNPRYLALEKGIVKLKRLLYYYPDLNNELEEPDIPIFRGIQIDSNKISLSEGKKPQAKKGMNNRAPPSARGKTQPTMNPRSAKKQVKKDGISDSSAKKDKHELSKTTPTKNLGSNRKESMNKESTAKQNNLNVKKVIKVRLTADEYRLLEKLRNKRMLTIK